MKLNRLSVLGSPSGRLLFRLN